MNIDKIGLQKKYQMRKNKKKWRLQDSVAVGRPVKSGVGGRKT